MPEKTIQLDIPLLLPEIEDSQDACLAQLENSLGYRKGIQRVHIKHDLHPSQLCLHYDPNLISLATVRRLAQQSGSDFTERYRHEQIPFAGMDAADAADPLAHLIEELPGVLHASINYAAGLAFVAYDSQTIQRPAIEQLLSDLGYEPQVLTDELDQAAKEPIGPPTALPGLVRERWGVISVALSGLFLLAGWIGQAFWGLPENAAVALFITSYLVGAYDIARRALPGLFKGIFDTDVLMLAAAVGAAALGEWIEGAFLLFLFDLGHVGEMYALNRARNAVDALGALMPKTAGVKQGDRIIQKPVDQLQIAETVVVRPGDRVPVDGRIVCGRSTVDQSAVTGESLPLDKGAGDEVFAGSINQVAALEVRVTKLARDSTLSRVMQAVTEAQEQQSPSQRFSQQFSSRFVPAVLLLVLLVILVPPLFRWMPIQDSFYRGMLLLVAASPCALVIGTPSAVLAGIAQAARHGVLIKGGLHLENLGAIQVMAFDKTGTLTSGEIRVTDLVPLNGKEPGDLLRVAAAVEQHSSHPLAQAVVRAAQDQKLVVPPSNGLENIAGRGVRSEVDGQAVLIGSPEFLAERNGGGLDADLARVVTQLESAGKTTIIVSQDDLILGILALADMPRPGAKKVLQELTRLGVKKLVMLTGDNKPVAQEIGRKVGVTDIRAGLLPEQKLETIKVMEQEHGSVAMIGDGVNDAPALARATVGIAMGGAGTAVALETADVALMADDLSRLPFAVGLSRASRRIIRQNLTLALGVIAMLMVTSVFGIVRLSGAVLLHEGSTILVVLNALRLLSFAPAADVKKQE